MHAYNIFWSHLTLLLPSTFLSLPSFMSPSQFYLFFLFIFHLLCHILFNNWLSPVTWCLHVHGCGASHPLEHGQLPRVHTPIKQLLTKLILTWMTLPLFTGRLSLLSLETTLFHRCSWGFWGECCYFYKKPPGSGMAISLTGWSHITH